MRLMIVLVKGHPVLRGLAFIELSGAVGDAVLSACLPTSTIHGIDHATASERNPTTTAPPITADGPHLSIRVGVRAIQRLSGRADGGASLLAVEKRRAEGERNSDDVVTSVCSW